MKKIKDLLIDFKKRINLYSKYYITPTLKHERKKEIENRRKNPELLLTLQNFIDIGGNIEKGMKVFTNPDPDGVHYLFNGNYQSEHTKIYTINKIIPNEGVKVEEKLPLLGTGWLFITIPIKNIKYIKNE